MGSARVGSNPILVGNFLEYFFESYKKKFPVPGIEPEPAGWEPAILTTRPYRILLASRLFAQAT